MNLRYLPIGVRLYLFLAGSLAVLLTPGMAVLYIVGISLDHGPLAGIVSSLGISLGGIFQVAGAAIGVTLLMEASALAPRIITYLGAGYLIYLGIQRLMEQPATDIPVEKMKTPYAKIFIQGFVVNTLNPKGWLFMAAFIPNFVNPGGEPVSVQIAVLGGIFILMGMFTDAIYATAAGGIRKLVRHKKGFGIVQKYIAAGVFIILGVALVVMDWMGKDV